MSQPAETAPPNHDDPSGFAALQREFNAFLADLEQVGKQIARRLAEEKASQSTEASSP